MPGDVNGEEEKSSSCMGSSSSSGSILDSEADEYVCSWEEPIDLSVFDCFFPELYVTQVSNE